MPTNKEAKASRTKAEAKARRKKWFILGFTATVIIGIVAVIAARFFL